VAVCPAVTVWLAGGEVIDGATAAAFTVNVALLLVALPAELVTTTEKLDPLSVVVVAGVVYELEVAPVIFVPFLLH
jgi:hypothetical protein